MFINNGKSLFGNTGLIISLIILCVLLYLSYNKCYIGNSISENFDCISNPTDPSCSRPTPIPTPIPTPNISNTPPPKNIRMKIDGGTITVNFTIDNSSNNLMPIKFVVVLAQYDSNKKNTGNNKFILSNESELNNSILVNALNANSNMCSLSDGRPTCQYVFNNVDVRDPAGNLYYYKVGVSSVYSNDYNSPFAMPYNINSEDKLFTINLSTDQQNQQYSNFLAYQKGQQQGGISTNVYNNSISTADGQYELIKSQLGHYPDNLLLDQQNIDQDTLKDLVDKSMAQAVLNVNIN